MNILQCTVQKPMYTVPCKKLKKKEKNINNLGWAKPDLWGLGGESWCIVGSLHYAKMILTLGDHFGIVKASYDAP